ncbi:phosphoserine phosphatase 1 [soil metagenome]
MKKLFYVRHGETEMNVATIWSGQTETPLTENGKTQAKATGVHVKTHLPPIDLIVCSPLSRAVHTAEIIAGEIGYPASKIVRNELLVERHFGTLEGTSSAGYTVDYSFEDIDALEGSETVKQVHERALQALAYIESLPQDNILVVSHGTFGRALRRVVNKLPHTHEYDLKHREEFRLKNAEIIELI